ncbi:unnamed protein product [Caenorhabditis auriculariae]|uniref:EndoU domain-containing protein n=1 Tax=Caenorhabditis auriculariae TaxID=2777116 RepID=A0A8S1GM20_9PELO|nr:unnamed protein product [Caenorhabditis auriculariae]
MWSVALLFIPSYEAVSGTAILKSEAWPDVVARQFFFGFLVAFFTFVGLAHIYAAARRPPTSSFRYELRRSAETTRSTMGKLTAVWTLLLCISAGFGQKIPKFDVSDQELLEMARLLRDVDDNKARRGQVVLDYQQHTNTRDSSDNARNRLFSTVDSSLLRKPTYELLLKMMDNYSRQTGIIEPRVSLQEEKAEVGEFLTVALNTRPFVELFEFFKRKGHPIATNANTFRFWIGQLWFSHYSRALGKADTSGFEHVFLGEAKNGEVSGMHNWVRFYALERNASEGFDYKGFIVKRFNVMAAVKFQWKEELKKSGSLLIGTSPEFDLALYTMCFLSRRGRETCNVEVDGCPLSITSFELYQRDKVYIGTIFPSAGRITEECRRKNS